MTARAPSHALPAGGRAEGRLALGLGVALLTLGTSCGPETDAAPEAPGTVTLTSEEWAQDDRLRPLIQDCRGRGAFEVDTSDLVPVLVGKLERSQLDVLRNVREELARLGEPAIVELDRLVRRVYSDPLASPILLNALGVLQLSEAGGGEKAQELLRYCLGHPQETVRNAAQLIRAGAQAVKLEGGRKRLDMVEALIDAEIPVMGHIGLTPQSVNAMGGFKVQAKSVEAAAELVEDAKALAAAGVFSIVLEGVPDVVAQMVTDAVGVPTIGIGAGPDTDGQVLVFHDLVGLENRVHPKFVRRYAALLDDAVAAVSAYAADVRSGAFPDESETYRASGEVAEALALYGREE